MATLTIDFEVWKEINNRRRSEAHSENDVLRELLGLVESGRGANKQVPPRPGDGKPTGERGGDASWLLAHGVHLPVGTTGTTVHKGRTHKGTIEAEGFRYNGRVYATLTEAAHAARGYKCNGWENWYVQRPGKS